ncbi:hemerythrin domain-containing protein [Marinicaulis aureus]|uniref:Hemerythrin domain-containing protein n=1 Tax=Hyphococcus aureus TaxID=2666033 RepID=A0ABW1L2K8_9PROT
MNIYDRIKQDHDHAREVMKKLKETTARAEKTRHKLFDEFKLDMWAHHKVEEAVFYSFLRDDTKMSDDSYEALNEHHVANGLLEELDTFPVGSDEWGVKFGALSELIEHHMDEEEKDFFPKARKLLSKEQADLMGKRFDARKKVVLAAIMPIDEDELKAA